MKLYHIVAVAKNGVIGKNNKLPWHFSSDLKHFKQLTIGHTVIMGRKTFESIGKALPERQIIVLTRRGKAGLPLEVIENPNILFFGSLEEALNHIKQDEEMFNQPAEVFIIGGADLYRQTIGQVDGIYFTRIHRNYEGDVSYPKIPESFKEKMSNSVEENGTKIEFIYYETGRM